MKSAAIADEELDTPRELAKALKVSPPTVMDFFRRGIIPAEIAIGRIYRFNRAKCREALAEHTRRQAALKGGAA